MAGYNLTYFTFIKELSDVWSLLPLIKLILSTLQCWFTQKLINA